MASEDLMQAKETFHFDGNGLVRRGQLARVGHSILERFPDMFEPLTVDFEYDPPKAEVGRHAPKPKLVQ